MIMKINEVNLVNIFLKFAEQKYTMNMVIVSILLISSVFLN